MFLIDDIVIFEGIEVTVIDIDDTYPENTEYYIERRYLDGSSVCAWVPAWKLRYVRST
jgi:hypothetical protein